MAQGINVVGYAILEVSTLPVDLVTSGVHLSLTLPSKAKRAYITCETKKLRWRADGDPPSSTEGHILALNGSISFTGANFRQKLEKIQFIATSDGDGVLRITYFD